MTKLGPHILNNTAEAQHWAQHAPLVKQAFDITSLRLVRPGIITICRPIWLLPRDGKQAAEDILARYTLWGFTPDYTELWNEFDEWGRAELQLRLRQCSIAVDILHRAGVKYVGDNIASTGTLEDYEWRTVLAESFGHMDFIPLHEYWGNQGFSTWHALRYRRVHNLLGASHPPFIITECGRDAVEGGGRGWKSSNISAEQYLVELKAYDRELQKDAYVIGATPFTSGATADWNAFNMDDLSDQLIEEASPIMTRQDAIAAAKDLWTRHGAQFNIDITYCQQWLNGFIQGGDAYWGAPEGGEMPVGDYRIVTFAKKRLWWKVNEWIISEGPFPLM